MNMIKTIGKLAACACVGFVAVLMPLKVESQSVNCSSILQRGTELRYVSAFNNEMTGYGLLKITSTIGSTTWSGTQINLAGGGSQLNLNGTMNGSTFKLFNQPYGETWTGGCNGRGIAGKVNDSITFILFKGF
jgi:hypothetical protein